MYSVASDLIAISLGVLLHVFLTPLLRRVGRKGRLSRSLVRLLHEFRELNSPKAWWKVLHFLLFSLAGGRAIERVRNSWGNEPGVATVSALLALGFVLIAYLPWLAWALNDAESNEAT